MIFLSLWMSSLSSRSFLVDAGGALGLGGVAREAELGRVLEGGADAQLLVQDVVLRDQADALAELRELLVQVAVVVEDVALVGRAVAGQRLEQRGLAGAGGADDADQRLLRDAEGDVPEDLLAAVDRDREVAGREGDLAGVDELLEAVADDPERRVADADDVVRAQQRGAGLRQRLTVDVGAVVAAEVVDLEAAAGHRAELGVVAGDLEVGDHQLILQRTADPHDVAQRELVERRRAAVSVGRGRALRRAGSGGALLVREVDLRLLRLVLGVLLLFPGLVLGLLLRGLVGRGLRLGVRLGRGLLRLLCHGRLRRGGAGAQIQPRAVRRVAQVDRRAGHELGLLDPGPVHVGAVGAAVVLDAPTPAVPGDGGMPPRHPGIVDHHVSLGVTPQRVRPGRIERPGPSIQFQYEFRHSSPT